MRHRPGDEHLPGTERPERKNGLSPERQKSILLTSRHERDGCWSSILQIWLNHWDEELPSCCVGVNCLYVRRKAPILRPTFLQIESTLGDQERLSSMIIPRRRVCETSLTSSFCSKSRTPVGRPWHAWECGAMAMATVLETLIERPRSARAREVSFSAAETVLQARAADVCEQYRVISSANDGIFAPCSLASDGRSATLNVKQQWSKDTALGDPLVARKERRQVDLLWTTTLCCWSKRKLLYQRRAAPLMPQACRVKRRCSCRTLSNAFYRSMKTAVVHCFLSRAWSQSSRVARTRSEQECEARNPNWNLLSSFLFDKKAETSSNTGLSRTLETRGVKGIAR